ATALQRTVHCPAGFPSLCHSGAPLSQAARLSPICAHGVYSLRGTRRRESENICPEYRRELSREHARRTKRYARYPWSCPRPARTPERTRALASAGKRRGPPSVTCSREKDCGSNASTESFYG